MEKERSKRNEENKERREKTRKQIKIKHWGLITMVGRNEVDWRQLSPQLHAYTVDAWSPKRRRKASSKEIFRKASSKVMHRHPAKVWACTETLKKIRRVFLFYQADLIFTSGDRIIYLWYAESYAFQLQCFKESWVPFKILDVCSFHWQTVF